MSVAIRLSVIVLVALSAAPAWAASESNMVTPAGSTATIHVILTISTSLGTSTDDDTRTMSTTGTATAILTPTAPPFGAVQFNAMHISFANTTFVFQLFCLPFIGCQTLNVNVNNLSFTAVQPFWSPIAPTGAVNFPAAMFHTTGSYSTTGLSTSSGTIDSVATGAFSGRITNPMPGIVRLDQLVMAQQTFVVPPDQLPAGITGLTFVIQPTLTNTTFQGPFTTLVADFDINADGHVNLLDFATFAGCLTGPGGGLATPGCADDDGDNDIDVDLLDAAEFQEAFTGP